MPKGWEIIERPDTNNTVMIAGWRQWADAGSVSSGLPEYLIQQTGAQRIGVLQPAGYYLFQIPGTHDLLRPLVRFKQGIPEMLQTPRNELYFARLGERGLLILLGDEPHLDIERYSESILDLTEELRIQRIVGLGGVYGELPYDKERNISAVFSLPEMRDDINRLGVSISDYEGGASIDSYICKRAGERAIEYAGLYAFVPSYDFSGEEDEGNGIRIETDFTAWLDVMRRVNYFLKLNLNLSDLEEKSEKLRALMETKVEELDNASPQLNLRAYFQKLSEEYTEVPFTPLDDVWEEEIRRLMDKFDEDEES